MNWRPSAIVLLLGLALATAANAQTLTWSVDTVATGLSSPTRVAYGPDGRLYVSELSGRIYAYTLGPDHKPTATQVINTIRNQSIRDVLGLAFNPLDPPDSVRLYVARTKVYAASYGPYLGRITKLTGPNFDQPVEIITGLPVAAFDHANNGMTFARDGNLYLQQGGNTNGGIPGTGINLGREEGPLSGATLIAYVHRPGFDGRITFDSDTPGIAHQTGGFDVEIFAPGMRNPYGIVHHSNGYLYGTDNGPNLGFYNGMMVDCNSTDPDRGSFDEINLIERGNYYGHPNRLRAASDPRQCKGYWPPDPPGPDHTDPLATFVSSIDGIVEYRADTFGGAMRGDLLCARYEGAMWRATLSADGRSIPSTTQPFSLYGVLDIAQAPDGTVYGCRFSTGQVRFMAPVETPPAGRPHVLAMWPDVGPLAGGRAAKLVGTRLGLAAPLEVKLGGVPVTVSGWDADGIRIVTPSLPVGWVDAYVRTAEGADTLTKAYYAMKFTLTDGDRIPPMIEVPEPERRYFDLQPPSFTLRVHDRLGVDSVMVRFDSGPWQVIAGGTPDTSVVTTIAVPLAQWQAAANGPHTVSLYARDDAHLLTMDGWTWIKGLPNAPSYRINSGGPAYVSGSGLTFAADSAFIAGTPLVTTAAIQNTSDPALFRDARVGGPGASTFEYRIGCANRAYSLRLHFAEIDSAHACPGCRVFDVIAGPDTIVRHLDLSVAGIEHAVVQVAEANVMNNQLSLRLSPAASAPLISAFEAYPLGLDDVTPPTVQGVPQTAGVTYDNPPLLSLSAADANDGELFGIYYAIDGGAWLPAVDQLKRKSYAGKWTLPGPVFQNLAPGMHSLQLRAVDLGGNTATTPAWSFGRSAIVGAPDRALAAPFALRVWPNPTRGGTLRVSFTLPRSGPAELSIYDLAGRVVQRRALGWRAAGPGEGALDLDATRLPAGLYFVRFDAAGVKRIERLAIVR